MGVVGPRIVFYRTSVLTMLIADTNRVLDQSVTIFFWHILHGYGALPGLPNGMCL